MALNAIAFSLFSPAGDNEIQPRYLDGLLPNLLMATDHYAGWEVVLHHDDKVPNELLGMATRSHDNLQLVRHSSEPGHAGSFWRFETADDDRYAAVIFRDIDSRLSHREAAAVQNWLSDTQPFGLHCIRDNALHRRVMLAGMWGCRRGAAGRRLSNKIAACDRRSVYGDDEVWLAEHVWPRVGVATEALVHVGNFAESPGERIGMTVRRLPDLSSPEEPYIGSWG